MVADLDVPVAIRAVPTVREPDGLAMSSRNRYLDPEQRRAARSSRSPWAAPATPCGRASGTPTGFDRSSARR